MTPAAHAAVAAVASRRCRSLGAALAVSFATHFPLDAIYHFEAFFPLSVLGPWRLEHTMMGLFAVLGILALPIVWWLLRKNRNVGLLACYGLLMSLLPFEPRLGWRACWALLTTAAWYTAARSPELRRWVLSGLVAFAPDLARRWVPALDWLHGRIHYNPDLDLGDWVSLLAAGRWQIHVSNRIFDAYYQIGYALEVLLEGAILFGCLYWLTRKPAADFGYRIDK